MLTSYSTCCLLDNLENFRVSVLSGSAKQASQCYKYSRDVFNLSDMQFKVFGETTLSKTELIGGGGMEILAASEKQTRAPRADMAIIDEACSAKSIVLESLFGQIITAEKFKIVILTTPDKLIHVAKKWWDKWKKLGIIRYHWDAFACNWIPRKNLEIFKLLFDEATYRIEVLGLWTSKSGSVFKYEQIMQALCDISELPPVDKINQFFLGIDWGDAHETVGTIVGYTGNPLKGTDQWYVYDQVAFRREDLDIIVFGEEDEGQFDRKRGLLELAMAYQATAISEHSSASSFGNRKLEDAMADEDLILKRATFSGKKNKVVGNARGRLERKSYKIPRKFKTLINQVTNYSYKMVNEEIRDEYEKKEDDHVDSWLFGNWGWNPYQLDIESIDDVADLGEAM